MARSHINKCETWQGSLFHIILFPSFCFMEPMVFGTNTRMRKYGRGRSGTLPRLYACFCEEFQNHASPIFTQILPFQAFLSLWLELVNLLQLNCADRLVKSKSQHALSPLFPSFGVLARLPGSWRISRVHVRLKSVLAISHCNPMSSDSCHCIGAQNQSNNVVFQPTPQLIWLDIWC